MRVRKSGAVPTTERPTDLRDVRDDAPASVEDAAPVLTYPGVTAVSWGPYRAEFVGPVTGGHEVLIRRHKTRKDRVVESRMVIVQDATEVGLREAIFTDVRMRREPLTPFDDANSEWIATLAAREFADVM